MTPKNLKEILEMEDISEKISYLKKGRFTPMPDTVQNRKDWEPRLHDIMDKEKVRKIKVLVEKEKTETTYDEYGNPKTVTVPAKYEYKEPNRISLPIEQDIVNIQTAFTVGLEPTLVCRTDDEGEKNLFSTLKSVYKTCKLKYQNKKIVRSWFSEQECAEYWYKTEDKSFWVRLKSKIMSIFGSIQPQYRLKSTLWSPFRGDKLYPFYDDSGDMVAFSREYRKRNLDGTDTWCFMVLTDEDVLVYEQSPEWALNAEKSFKHGFKKLPIIYTYRRETLCAKIRPVRERIEKCLSGYADCIDNHFFPKLLLFGELGNMYGSDYRNQMLELTGDGANAQYLTWNQSADPIKVEIDTYFNQAYALCSTPRISFDQIKGTGNALSGTAFRYVFMAAHMAVQNHAEDLEEFLQRRVNFLVSALGTLNPTLLKPSETIDVETEIQPFIIDSEDDKVSTSVKAVSGGVWSLEHGVAFCSDYGETADEVEQILEDKKKQLDMQKSEKSNTIESNQ